MSWVVTCVIIAIVVLLFTGGLSTLKSLFGDFGNLFKGAVGMADAIFSLLSEQLATCKAHGYFAFWKGCIIGIGALGYGMALAIGFVVRAYASFRKDTPGAAEDSAAFKSKETAEELGATAKDVTDEMRDEGRAAEKVLLDKGLTWKDNGEVFKAAINATFAEKASTIADERASHITTPDEKKVATDRIAADRKRTQERYTEDTKDMDNDDKAAAKEAAEAGGFHPT